MNYIGKLIIIRVKNKIFNDAIKKLDAGKKHLEIYYVSVESTEVRIIPHTGVPVDDNQPQTRTIAVQWFAGQDSNWRLADERVIIID